MLDVGVSDNPNVTRRNSNLRSAPNPNLESERARVWSDEELLAALRRGDPRGALPLYRALRPVIDRTLRRVLHGRHREFDDLMQSTFEKVLSSLSAQRFEGRSSLRTWAAAIATHVALDSLRRVVRSDRRIDGGVESSELPSPVRPDARLEALAELRRTQKILSEMNEDLAETLLLHDVLGHSIDEIAILRGATPSATQSRLHRGRLELSRRSAQTIGRSRS